VNDAATSLAKRARGAGPPLVLCTAMAVVDYIFRVELSTRRAQGLAGARPADPDALVHDVDAVLADNHFADFVLPICAAARARGLPVVIDVDKALEPGHPLPAFATHPIFSAEALRATSGVDDLAAALTAEPLHKRRLGSKAADQRRPVPGRYIRSTPVSGPTGPVLGGS
jgi:hypothetical protein